MYIIPAIDLIDGKVVRLKGGDYSKKSEYSSDPVEIAKRFEDVGLTRLHLVDLDGAKGSGPVNLKTLEAITSKTSLLVDYGGGIKSKDHLIAALSAGANEVSLGSIVIKKWDEVISWISDYKDKVILSADGKNGFIAVSGWLESTELTILDFIKRSYEIGFDKVISTDISRDGMLSGPSFELYNAIKREVPFIKIIASGGVATVDDLYKLKAEGLYGAIVGKAYYEGRITLDELVEVERAC